MSLLNDITEALANFERGGTVRLTHYSHVDGLTEIDPDKMFSGADRRNREVRSITGRTFPRAYFGIGVGEEGGYGKERALKHAPYEYVADYPVKKIYDMDEDPENFKEEISRRAKAAKESHPNKILQPDIYERIRDEVIKDAGYHGIAFDNPSFGQACYLWYPVKVTQVNNADV